jgi:hypothetical protein
MVTPDSEAEKAAKSWADGYWAVHAEPPRADRGSIHWKSSRSAHLAGQAHERERIIAWWREKTKDEFWTARDLLQEFLKEQAE